MKLTLIRHGQTNGNLSNNYSIENCDRLSVLGKEQADLLAQYLKALPFDRLLVSPLIRAVETIYPTLRMLNIKAEICPELAECCWHEERETPAKDFRLSEAEDLAEYGDYIFSKETAIMKPAGGETFGEGLQRVLVFYEKIMSQVKLSQHVILVTHGYWINEFLNILLKTKNHIAFHHHNCGFTNIKFSNHTFEVMYTNKMFIQDVCCL